MLESEIRMSTVDPRYSIQWMGLYLVDNLLRRYQKFIFCGANRI